MATLAAVLTPFASLPFLREMLEGKPTPKQIPLALQSTVFNHALVALAAKLAAVDGQVNEAEYHAFRTFFTRNEDESKLRSQFIKQIDDRSTAIQYARQIASMTEGDAALHKELIGRLLSIATADGMLNAGEMEWLRAVADALGLERETFRALIAAQLVPATSPYEILGVSPAIDDAELRARYMAKVQWLHPDRYLAAGASAETVAMLSDQLAALNAAYQQIRDLRAKKRTKYTKSAKAAA